jgi:hypothetical protein
MEAGTGFSLMPQGNTTGMPQSRRRDKALNYKSGLSLVTRNE